ncbi:TolC family protein [uncultured Draconibacterium sp.]|uniref:TolC family protein n=1 Tax=uncultured Draconibacterium sp. TaxID=1573823 RepID=UPI00326003C5
MYKNLVKIIASIFVFSCYFGALNAQTYNELIENSSFEKDIVDMLPPLAELQENAILYSPVFKILDADVAIGEYMILEERREWMRWLGFEGGVKYGLFDNIVLSEELGDVELSTAKTQQTRYYGGLFLKMPISSLADKSNVKVAKAEKEKLSYQREARIKELRQLIIIQYGNVVKEHRGMIIKNNAVENYRVQMLRAQNDYQNGKINISDYARLDDMLSKAVLALEDAKTDFITAFMILEETVGTKIQLKK